MKKAALVGCFLYWLPTPEISIQHSFEAILTVFENASYIGELRQRWHEIKKLLKGELQDNMSLTLVKLKF